MTTIDIATQVKDLVIERPGRARVFEKLGIDYCCGGKRPLAEVCEEKGLDAAAVTAALVEVDAAPVHGDPSEMTLTALADHIEAVHHAWLREEMPRLRHLTQKVANRHGERLPWVIELAAIYAGLEEELTEHMMKEEMILFPLIRALEAGQEIQGIGCGHLEGPVSVMEAEHAAAGEALARMRELTSDYVAPEDACTSFRVMLDGLHGFEKDMHQHIHKENNILFPRAFELRARAAV